MRTTTKDGDVFNGLYDSGKLVFWQVKNEKDEVKEAALIKDDGAYARHNVYYRKDGTVLFIETYRARWSGVNHTGTWERISGTTEIVKDKAFSSAEFREVLSLTLDRGQVTRTFILAYYDYDRFIEIFGTPESDVEGINNHRLWHYSVADGVVQLDCTVLPNMVIVQGMNKF